jgi:hypothetical protein
VEQNPRDAVTRSFRVTEIVAAKTLIQILTGSHVAAAGLRAAKYINMKHGGDQ